MSLPVRSLNGVAIRRVDGAWPLPEGGEERVAAHWRTVRAANPRLWNGRVLATRAPGSPGGIAIGPDGVLRAEALEGDFAAFLAWRDWGFPEIGLRNLFGSALVVGRDGALVFGVMGGATANAGRVYPPGGSLDPSDVGPGGEVDVLGSIARELREETGLSAGEADAADLLVAFDGPRVSVARLFRFDATASQIADRIRAFLADEADPELAGVHVVASPRDLPPADRCPGYAAALARHVLALG